MILEPWSSGLDGRNVLFRNFIILMLGLLCDYTISRETAGFLFPICIVYSLLLPLIIAGGVSLLETPSYLGHLKGREIILVPFLYVLHGIPWPWALSDGWHLMKNSPFLLQKSFSSSLTRGVTESGPSKRAALALPRINCSILRDDKYVKREAREAKRSAQHFTVTFR